MDPKGILNDEWVPDVKIPGNADSGKGKTYARHVTYNDGTETWTYYRYNSAGQDGQDQVVSSETLTNEAQAKRWAEQSKAAQTQQDQAERQIASRQLETNPQTGRPSWHVKYRDGSETWDESGVPTAQQNSPVQQAQGERAQQEQVERKRNSQQIGIPFTDVERAQWEAARQNEQDARGEREKAAARQERLDLERAANTWTETTKSTTRNDQTGQSTAEVTETNALGQTRTRTNTETVITKPDKPMIIDLPNGRGKAQLIPDADNPSLYRAVPIDGTGTATAKGTDFGTLKLEAGSISKDLMSAFEKANARRIRGEITSEEMRAELEPIFQMGNARINEINGILTTQQNSYREESANYRQKMGFAERAVSNAFSPSRSAHGSMDEGRAALAELALGAQYAKMFAPEPTMGPGLQQANAMNLNGVTIDMKSGQIHVGGSAPSPAPDITNPLAQSLASGGIKEQARAQTSSELLQDPFFDSIKDELMGPNGLPGEPVMAGGF